jgi:hypothetical protein
MTDVVGQRLTDNLMSMTKIRRVGGTLNGLAGTGGYTFHNVPAGIQWGVTVPLPPSASYVNRIMSQTGPLTPSLYLPVALFELKDVPKMLWHAGNLLHKIQNEAGKGLDPISEGAAATLAYQFGWDPLIGDIKKMLAFATRVAKRQKMLKGAHSANGIKRRVTLATDSVTASGYYPVWSTFGSTIVPRYNTYSSVKQWATMRWKVRAQTDVGKPPDFVSAFRIDNGLTAGEIPIEVWKAMPWSWAIDWFADISNLLQASYNSIYYIPSPICVMTHHESRTFWDAAQNGGLSFTGGFAFYETKSREVFAPVPSASLKLPFLDGFKLSIIGSMTVLSIKGRATKRI